MITLTCAITNRPMPVVLGDVYSIEAHPKGSLVRAYSAINGLVTVREFVETPDKVAEKAKWETK